MRRGVLIVLVLLVAGIVLTLLGARLRPGERIPTVVVISIDTLRADHVGPRDDGESLTPHIDTLATEGVVFERAWTVAPLTVPSHVTMLSGQLPPLHGLRTNHPPGVLPPQGTAGRPFPLLAEVFRDVGHRTAGFVSASVLRDDRTGLGHGFQVYDAPEAAAPGALHDTERRGEDTVAAALRWLRSDERPAFLFVHLFDPHAPYDAPGEWSAGPTERATPTGYAAEVRYADHCVGLLLEGLRASGHGEAVVVLTSDHGEGLGEHGEATHGYLLHEATLHVPLIVSAPGRLAPMRRSTVVSLAQLAPTLVSVAGLPLPSGMPTKSLLDKGSSQEDGEAWAESLYAWESFRWAQLTAYRVGDSKAVETGADGIVTHDLSVDPRELEGEVRAASGGHPAVDGLLRVRENVLDRQAEATLAAGASRLGSVPYFGAADARGTTLLPLVENAALPSPYARIAIVRRLDEARTLLAAGRVDAARRILREVTEEDAGNPEAPHWLGRALMETPTRHEAAFEAFAEAFDRGYLHPRCVTQALHAAVLHAQLDPVSELVDRAATLLERARGQGMNADAPLLAVAAALAFARDDVDAAEREIRLLREARRGPADDRALAQLEAFLAQRR